MVPDDSMNNPLCHSVIGSMVTFDYCTPDTGCKETRKSSSAGAVMLGGHTVKAYTRKQKVIAKSSAEAELYAAALGASEAKGVQSMMRDLGIAVKPVLNIDAKASPEALRCGVLVGAR